MRTVVVLPKYGTTMKKTLLLLFVLLCSHAKSETKLSFREAITATETLNHKLKATEYQTLAAKRNRQAALGLFFPKINLRGAYICTQRDIAIDINPLKGFASQILPTQILELDWRYTIQKRDFGFIGSDITIPIFTGGKIIAANKAAKIAERTAQTSAVATKAETITELAERYFGYILACNVVKVRQTVASGIEKHLTDIELLKENGMIAQAELLYAKYKYAEAQSELKSAILQRQTALDALLTTTGLESVEELTTPIFILPAIEDITRFQSGAIENNPQLQIAEQQLQLARQGINLSRADFFPQIAIMGGGGFTHQVTDILPRWAVGIGVNFKIFDGLSREYKHSAAVNRYKSAEQIISAAKQDISLLVTSLYNTTISHLNRAISLNSSVAFSVELLRAKRVAFDAGAATSTEVIDAVMSLSGSQIERLEAAYNFDTSLAKLLEVSGASDSFTDYCESMNKITIEYETY